MKIKKIKKNTILLTLIITIQFLALIYLVSQNGALIWDEPVYLANARDKITHSNFSEDFRFPLLSTIIAGTWMITGESIIIAQILMILITIATTITFFFIAKQYLKENYALLATLLFALTTQTITWGFRIYTDILGILLTLITLLILIEADKEKTNKKQTLYILLAGIFAGLAFTARLSTIIILIILGIYFLLKKHWIQRSIIFTTGFIISLMPWLIHGAINHNNPLYFALSQTTAILEYTARESPRLLMNYITNEYGFAIILILLNIIYFKKQIKTSPRKKTTNNKTQIKEYREKIILILTILLTQIIFYAFIVKLKLARYLIELSPFIILLIITGIQATENIKIKHQKTITILLIIIALTTILTPTIQNYQEIKEQEKCTSNGALKKSINYIDENTQQGDRIVSSIWVYYGYHNNLKVSSPWTEDVELLIKKHDPKYFILSENVGVPLNNKTLLEPKIKFEDGCGWDITIYKPQKS